VVIDYGMSISRVGSATQASQSQLTEKVLEQKMMREDQALRVEMEVCGELQFIAQHAAARRAFPAGSATLNP
jgi:hypothetical protein